MYKTLIVGAGMAGLTAANLLQENDIDFDLIESNQFVGGLIHCETIETILYHQVGGHVFNSKNLKVLDWFYSKFDVDNDFVSAKRNAKIYLNHNYIGYPIENYLYQLPSNIVLSIVKDLLEISRNNRSVNNFEDFLRSKFGNTLCELYFFPYNKKIWMTDLSNIALEWLDGKLPNPSIDSIFFSNIVKSSSDNMVHANFLYPKKGGSQFIADTLSRNIDISLSTPLKSISLNPNYLKINGNSKYTRLIYTGDIRELHRIILNPTPELDILLRSAIALKSHGTSNVLCECDPTDLSWLYIPEIDYKAHRIIYTGNFSLFNNGNSSRSSCVVEFSGELSYEEMAVECSKLPGNLKPLSFRHSKSSYVIHDKTTKDLLMNLKSELAKCEIYLLGRFAEWEYFNMDKVIESAMRMVDLNFKKAF